MGLLRTRKPTPREFDVSIFQLGAQLIIKIIIIIITLISIIFPSWPSTGRTCYFVVRICNSGVFGKFGGIAKGVLGAVVLELDLECEFEHK